VRKVLVYIKSLSIGDTVAAVPYINKFQETNFTSIIYVSISDWLIPYFETIYPDLKFIGKNSNEVFDKTLFLDYNFNKSIQQGYAEQLGFINTPYIRPNILIPNMERPIKNKYITIGVHSTSQLKYWNHPKGKKVQPESPYWNELCGMIRKEGYTPVVVEQDELFGWAPYKNGLPNKANKKFGQSFLDSMNLVYHSEFYIGLSSGMSWVAHAMGKPVAMIANFTEDWNEFDLSTPDYIRITNKNVCHGCWNKINKEFKFDTDDWYWCSKHKDTNRQFECHTSITPEHVFNEIKKWIKKY
jgi:autotransporter strand-loop-strand O-heptosyltransferase